MPKGKMGKIVILLPADLDEGQLERIAILNRTLRIETE